MIKKLVDSDKDLPKKLVISGVNGLMFESKNSSELEDRMRKLLCDKELYMKRSEGAQKLYREKYTADINARNIENIYLSVLRRKWDEKED